MITKTQAAAGGGVAVLGTGGTAAGTVLSMKGSEDEVTTEITTPKIMNFIQGVPKFVVLAMDSDFDSKYGNETGSNRTVGKRYGWYLTSIYDEESKEWWAESYKKWQSDDNESNTYDYFKKSNIKSAFADKNAEASSDKALNQVCEEISKKTIGGGGYKKEDIFKYCSPMGKIPEDISDSSENDDYPSGYLSSSISNLISTKNKNNEIFWKLRNYEFFGKDDGDGLGANLNDGKNSLFHDLYLTKKTGRRNIKNVCEQAYKLGSNNTGKAEEEKVEKFCGWGNS